MLKIRLKKNDNLLKAKRSQMTGGTAYTTKQKCTEVGGPLKSCVSNLPNESQCSPLCVHGSKHEKLRMAKTSVLKCVMS